MGVAEALRDHGLVTHVAAVRSSPDYEAAYDEPELYQRAQTATLDWEQAKAVTDAIWPLVSEAVAYVEGERDALEDIAQFHRERADKAEAAVAAAEVRVAEQIAEKIEARLKEIFPKGAEGEWGKGLFDGLTAAAALARSVPGTEKP